MLVKKRPFQYWNYRDTRKTRLERPKSPVLAPDPAHLFKTVKGKISHHILLPIAELPEKLLNRFRADLTLVNPDYEKARKYGKGLVSYSIPEFVRFYWMDSTYLGLPRSTKMNYIHNRFADCGMTLELEDVRPEFETIPFPEKGEMAPLFYQNEAIDKILGGNIVLKFKCGKGKTILSLMAVAKLRLRTLILVRTNILLYQWVDAIKQIFDVEDDQIGIINGKTKREGLITVATEQSISAMSRDDKRRIGEVYGHIIVDEAHEVGAKVYRELMKVFKARKMTGLSATPDREDKMTPVLKLSIGPVVEVDDLGPFNTELHLRKTSFTYIFDGKKDKYHELIKALIHDEDRNRLIVEDLVSHYQAGRLVLCYSSRIEHMEILENMLKDRIPGVKTDILASRRHGATMRIQDQELVKQKVRDQEIQVLNGGKMVEQGFDAPPLSVAVLATPTKSKRLIEQVLGRCQREFPGKSKAVLCDYVDDECKVLLYQFFAKNRKLYKNFNKFWLEENPLS